MNYQHAFHAGNFADVHKHIVLTRILEYLRQKPAAFRVVDTHAGAGRYDLLGPQAARSSEWRDGIGRVFAIPRSGAAGTVSMPALIAPYLDVVAALNPGGKLRLYPGSPLIVRAFLRRQDRLIACELEPKAAASLKGALHGDVRGKALVIDGWVALFANIPPKERRGLVVIDPPYEESVEFTRLPDTLAQAHRKWPSGLYLAWYARRPMRSPAACGDLIFPKSYVANCQSHRHAPTGRSPVPGWLSSTHRIRWSANYGRSFPRSRDYSRRRALTASIGYRANDRSGRPSAYLVQPKNRFSLPPSG